MRVFVFIFGTVFNLPLLSYALTLQISAVQEFKSLMSLEEKTVRACETGACSRREGLISFHLQALVCALVNALKRMQGNVDENQELLSHICVTLRYV
jgi:hypothetical protein